MQASDLSFSLVDDWAFSAVSGKAIMPTRPVIADIGALIELAQLARQYPSLQTQLAAVVDQHPLAPLVAQCERNCLMELGEGTGVIRLSQAPLPDTERTRFSLRAKSAAVSAGFAARSASQLTAAMLEMLDNLIEHSGARHTGRIAYQATSGRLTFVVADAGMGALSSVRANPRYASLTSDRDALPLVLQNGCSRHPDPDRGKGFNDLFRGLANHNGALRFRSGSAAVLIDGHSPDPLHPQGQSKAGS